MTYIATEPREVLIRAFEITEITQDDQYDFIQRCDAYPGLSVSQFIEAWNDLASFGLIVETTRQQRCRSHGGYCYKWVFTDAGRDALADLVRLDAE